MLCKISIQLKICNFVYDLIQGIIVLNNLVFIFHLILSEI